MVLDEIQRQPDLFPILRVLADRRSHPARFLVLGSASPTLLQQSSESLAGRIHYHELGGFALDEVGQDATERLWLRGGFPPAFLAASDVASAEWRRDFVRTFLERDLPQLGVRVPALTLRRFWTMLAHYHAQVWNGAELARAFGVTAPTVRHYLDTLTAALVLRQLPPWFENLSKRQVKVPKDLHCRQRVAPHPAERPDPHRPRGASKGGSLVGRLCPGGGDHAAGGAARGVLFLGDARWRGTRSPGGTRAAALGL